MDPTEFAMRLDVFLEVRQPPYQILQAAVDYQWKFADGHWPSEKNSEEDPPIRLTDQSDVIAIDGVLGLYNPNTQEITVFRKGVSRVADILKASTDDLRQIVLLHEWAHALLHLGLEETDRVSVLRDDSQWAERVARMNTWYNALNNSLHESLAQLLTREGLRWLRDKATIPDAQDTIDRISSVFERLTRRSPSAYQIDKYDKVPKSRIIGSVRLLKSGGLVGADAWDTVVRW